MELVIPITLDGPSDRVQCMESMKKDAIKEAFLGAGGLGISISPCISRSPGCPYGFEPIVLLAPKATEAAAWQK